MKLNEATARGVLRIGLGLLIEMSPAERRRRFPGVTLREIRFTMRVMPSADMEYEQACNLIKRAARELQRQRNLKKAKTS